MPNKLTFPLTIEAISGSDGNAQVLAETKQCLLHVDTAAQNGYDRE